MNTGLHYPLWFFVVLIGFSSCQNQQEIRREQYFVEGMELYKVHCANCHQNDGSGLKNLYPPIAGSDYLAKNKEKIMCLMKYGQATPLVVNGQTYTQPMPANRQLQPLDIAEITTYLYTKWGNEKTINETAHVKKVLENCPQADH